MFSNYSENRIFEEKKNLDIQYMLEKATESISIVEILEKDFKKKEWF